MLLFDTNMFNSLRFKTNGSPRLCANTSANLLLNVFYSALRAICHKHIATTRSSIDLLADTHELLSRPVGSADVPRALHIPNWINIIKD
jgi:hypothetical protein